MKIFITIDVQKIDYLVILAYCGIYLMLFILSELAYHKGQIDAEKTRKFVHVFTGMTAISFPFYISSLLDLILLCSIFIFTLPIAKQYNYLPSINAIARKSQGSILFPIAVILCFVVQQIVGNYTYYILPIAILSISDPLAALVGKQFPFGKYNIFGDSKTMSGSLVFFISAWIISFGILYYNDLNLTTIIITCSILATITALSEALSIGGYDNISIPICTILVLLFSNF